MMQAFLFLCGERTETMIQIFGKPKCFDTRKAERYFKERRIPYQLVDVTKKGISPGEYRRIRAAVGGLQALLDEKSAAYASCFIAYLALESQVEEKLLEHPELLKTPVVCCGKAGGPWDISRSCGRPGCKRKPEPRRENTGSGEEVSGLPSAAAGNRPSLPELPQGIARRSPDRRKPGQGEKFGKKEKNSEKLQLFSVLGHLMVRIRKGVIPL